MPRLVSLNMRQAAFAQETDEVPVILITVLHKDLPAPLRFSSDPTIRITDSPLLYGTISRGQWFYFLPYSVLLPDDKDDAPPAARLVLDNVGRDMIELLRQTTSPAIVQMELVLAGTPDIVEIDFPDLDLVGVDYDQNTISLTLEINALMHEPFPAGKFTPGDFPGVHGG